MDTFPVHLDGVVTDNSYLVLLAQYHRCVEEGQEKEGMRCFLDDFRAFGINADQRTTAA